MSSETILRAVTELRNFYPSNDSRFTRSVSEFYQKNLLLSDKEIEANVIRFLASQLRQNESTVVSLVTIDDHQEALQKLRNIRERLVTRPKEGDPDVPSFILSNIEDMPANRGYLWKGKTFLGKKQAKVGPKVLFEPRRKKTLIHVYENGFHKVYEKEKGEKHQTLIQKTIMVVEEQERPRCKRIRKPVPVPNPTIPVFSSRFQILCWSDSDSDSDSED